MLSYCEVRKYLSTPLSNSRYSSECIPPFIRSFKYSNLSALRKNLTYGYPDLNLPGSAEYIDVLEIYLGKAYTKEMTPKAALDAAAAEWEKITERLGRANQIKIYKDLLQSWKEAGILE